MSEPLRVLLVEDDASLQRFVDMALEDQGVALSIAPSVEQALDFLAGQQVDLLITDLMLPGRHGLDLLQTLRDQPALRGAAQLAAFSAGLHAPVRQQLASLGVRWLLPKPCALKELQDCIQAARHSSDTTPVAPSAADACEAGEADAHAEAIRLHFGGNQALFEAFLAHCRQQFPHDLAQGREALARGDAERLRHLAHSLKSVLRTLGYQAASGLARQLEDDAAAGRQAALGPGWMALDQALQQLR
jgi:DNA-binding response OmpR family regulator